MILYLKRKYPTDNNYYATVDVAQEELSPNKTEYYGISNQCPITNSTGYIDVSGELPSYMEEFTGGVFYTTDEENKTNAYAFRVTRHEVNNFNRSIRGEELHSINYWRIYFTIDWWTTYLFRGVDVNDKIDGVTHRAHVNDLEVRYDTLIQHTSNTYPEAEYDIGIPFKNSNPASKQWWLYLLSTKRPLYTDVDRKTVLHGVYGTTDDTGVEIKKYATGYYLYAIPLRIATSTVSFIEWKIRLTKGGTTVDLHSFVLSAISTPDIISDSSVIQMSISNFPPNTTTNVTCYDDTDFSKIYPATFSGHKGGEIAAMWVGKVGGMAITADRARNVDTALILTYEDYLNTISKQYFYPYEAYYVEKNNTKVFIDTSNGTFVNKGDYILSVYPTADMTGYTVVKDSRLLSNEERYELIEDDGLFQPLTEKDRFTRLNARISGIKSTVQMATAIANIKDIGGVVDATANTIGNAAEIHKMLRDGTGGLKSTSHITSNIFDPLRVVHYRPREEVVRSLQNNLALYGYNTPLNIREILKKHQRRYFNYIRGNIAVLYPFCAEAVSQFKEMFSNGVFLWHNTDSYFDTRVVNLQVNELP